MYCVQPFNLRKPRSREPREARFKLIKAIGGSMQGPDIQEGIDAYIDYIEHQIAKCELVSSAALNQIFGPPSHAEDRTTQLLNAVVIVANFLKTLDTQSTLDDIAQDLLFKTTGQSSSSTVTCRFGLSKTQNASLCIEHHIVFACIGWLSMLFTPLLDFSGQTLRILDTPPILFSANLYTNTSLLQQQPGAIQRPLGSMLRGMGVLPIPCPTLLPLLNGSSHSPTRGTDSLRVSVLCYFSLRHIGGLSIVWVDTLLDHCKFDLVRKELKMFRFPAYCFQAYNGQPNIHVLTSILKAHTCQQTCERDLPETVQMYLREIFLSYRLLFGQDQRSRRLFRSHESHRAGFSSSTADPILGLLCGSKHTSPITGLINEERQVFDARVDFPYLGARLLELHNYNANQTPSAWHSIFVDRRDPQESFKFFWTVILIGGLSVTLSLVQTGVSIAQLVTALR